jgi:polyisoprenyl-teichoic acid--peptidoglycan teichoic acid transferase
MKYADMKIQTIYNSTPKEKGSFPAAKIFVGLFILGAIAAAVFIYKDKITQSFNPITIIANASSVNLKETDGRTNILILGVDSRSTGEVQGTELTDTILIASISRVDKNVVLISLPRDLWVQNPATGSSSKINAVYALTEVAKRNGTATIGGADALKKVIEDVTGIPIHYHVLVTFDLFKEAIDTLGGINITVDNAFTDYEYPVQGNEDASCGRSEEDVKKMEEENKYLTEIFPCRYQTVTFNAGLQKMNGATALEFARSRHSTDNNEGNDFARAKRQQKVVMAAKDTALSLETLTNPLKLKELYDTYARNVDTNVDLVTAQNLYLLSQKTDFSNIGSVVLDTDSTSPETGGLLYNPTDATLYGGQWVLIPRTGDYTQIHAYVSKYLFGSK